MSNWLLVLSLVLFCGLLGATEHQIHFANSDHELHVYHIKGAKPGKTLLIIGGMHNEPGGYVTADLFADMQLQQGNLIVVPRANMPAIVSNKRGINGDMNRNFSGARIDSHSHLYEEKVVAVLKELIAKSDVLLNLHDGYGYYRPTHESDLKNPKRWGQAIITDRELFDVGDKMLHLGERAQRVVDSVNSMVENPLHKFHYKNTRTKSNDSHHKEQRTSATFFALYHHGIESYGVETSKNIRSLEQKVAYQTAIVNAFLAEFDIIPEPHKTKLAQPQLAYLLLSVNNQRPVAYRNGETINLVKGDLLTIERAITNYQRGVVVDIEDIGQLNDAGKTFQIDEGASIRVLKDQYLCGRIFVNLVDPASQADSIAQLDSFAQSQKIFNEPTAAQNKTQLAHLLIEVNGNAQRIEHGETVRIKKDDELKLIDYIDSQQNPVSMKLNFVGFVGNPKTNDGQDRGYKIKQKNLIRRFSVNGLGQVFEIKAEKNNKLIAQFYVSTQG
jgi:hypothetical protein